MPGNLASIEVGGNGDADIAVRLIHFNNRRAIGTIAYVCLERHVIEFLYLNP